MNSRGNVHVEFADALDIGEILRGDFRDGDVVDIDILLANQIEQQVERAFVDFAEVNGEGKVAVFFPGVR